MYVSGFKESIELSWIPIMDSLTRIGNDSVTVDKVIDKSSPFDECSVLPAAS